MLKKFLRRGAVGFPLGIFILILISLLSDNDSLVSPALAQQVGCETAALALNLVLSGIFGALCMGGTVFYEIEDWSLTKATFLHYLLIIACFPPLAWFLRWFTKPTDILIMTGIQTVAFFLIWLIMYLRCRAEVKELNELNAQREKQQKDGTE